jgi:hypothetical protein
MSPPRFGLPPILRTEEEDAPRRRAAKRVFASPAAFFSPPHCHLEARLPSRRRQQRSSSSECNVARRRPPLSARACCLCLRRRPRPARQCCRRAGAHCRSLSKSPGWAESAAAVAAAAPAASRWATRRRGRRLRPLPANAGAWRLPVAAEWMGPCAKPLRFGEEACGCWVAGRSCAGSPLRLSELIRLRVSDLSAPRIANSLNTFGARAPVSRSFFFKGLTSLFASFSPFVFLSRLLFNESARWLPNHRYFF